MPDRHGPYRNYRYLLEIDGIAEAAFSECTIPEVSTEAIEYREGNEPPTVRKLGGLISYGDLTMQRGVTESLALYEWWQLVEQGNVDEARRSIAVVMLDEEGSPGPRFEFRDAWVSQYDAPDLNATGNEVAVESITVAHEGMERVA